MQEQSEGRSDRGGPRDGGDDRSRDREPRRDGGGEGGGVPGDTRFLQLEMSQVMYAEAEEVARPAFRELLLEAAKGRLRERFGDKITALANLAVDELLNGVEASFEVEARIQKHNEDRRPPADQLRQLFAGARGGGESRPAGAQKRDRRTSRRGRGRP